MYTGHFGLDDGPFHGKAEGQDVYVGPQQAVVIGRLKKVLSIADTAVAVSGPVGVGKTTLVRRALSEITGQKIIVSVDRIRLEPDEVLDLLLARFDVSRQPKGTIQRVAAFRRLLHERLANDTRIYIVVEDAERCGIDALVELEALTATDSGEPVGANIVLIGGDDLSKLLRTPALARLSQRIRLRQAVAPFDATEVEGYMRHCLEAAGGVLEQIFEPGTARIAHRYSGGVARVVDNLCESALVAAAEAGLATILPEFLQEVAENCGLEALVADPDEAARAAETVHAPPKLSVVGSVAKPGDEPDFVEPGDAANEATAAAETPVAPMPADAAADADTPEETEAEAVDDASIEPSVADRHVLETAHAHTDNIPILSNSMRVAVFPGHALFETPVVATPAIEDPVDAEDEPGEERLPAVDAHDIPEQEVPATRAASDAAHADLAEPVKEDATADAEDIADDIADGMATGVAEPEVQASVTQAEAECHAAGEPAAYPAVEAPSAIEPDAEDAPAIEEPAEEAVAESVEEPTEAGGVFELGLARNDEIPSPAIADDDDGGATLETEALSLSYEQELTLSEDEATDVISDGDHGEADDRKRAGEHAETGKPGGELDALEAAIHAANAWQLSTTDEEAGKPAAEAAPAGSRDAVPAITLDAALEKRRPAPNDLNHWAEELSKAKSLEDISDILAETLFGSEEMEAISAEIRASKAAEAGTAPATGAAPAPASQRQAAAPSRPAALSTQPTPANAAGARKPISAATRPPAATPTPKEAQRPAAAGGINMTISQRIAMVNSLKGKNPVKPPSRPRMTQIVLGEQPDPPATDAANAPESIETQIDVAITQSRKALSEADIARMAAAEEGSGDRKDKGGSRGLFGFFRRSSKS